MDRPERPCNDQLARRTHLLAVYAMPDCPGWDRAHALVAAAGSAGFLHLEVRVVDLSRAAVGTVPDCVVASPTWVLDDRRLSLGNPEPGWLLERLGTLEGGD